ncbi:MAG: type II secretion system protein GspM [Sphingobium sp.]
MESLRYWWNARAPREKILLAIMAALIASMVLWLGVYRPVESGLHDAALANAEATERHADVARKVELLQKGGLNTPIVSTTATIGQIVGQSAGEAGFTLDRMQERGVDHADVSIASARATALLGWIAKLEGQGVVLEKLSVNPSGATGTVSAQISFKRAGI